MSKDSSHIDNPSPAATHDSAASKMKSPSSEHSEHSLTQSHRSQPAGTRAWILWFVTAQLIVLYTPTLTWLWNRWTMGVWHHAHGLFVLSAVVYLVGKQIRNHRYSPETSNPWGFAILIPALLLHMLDAGMHTQLLSAASLLLALPGLALVFLGKARTRAIIFPLSFLVFALPIPLAFTEPLHLLLRQLATAGSAFVVTLLGIPTFVDGTTLHIPKGSLHVADACSGFSTLYATAALAYLMAYFCADNRRRILVLLAAAPVAIAANMIRVVLLVLLVSWHGIDILETSLHTISGLFTFAISLPIIFWLAQTPRSTGAPG